MINVEIKAKVLPSQQEAIRTLLKEGRHPGSWAVFHGTDCQEDTYFNVRNGRLKLREGEIENCLIHYERLNQAGPKTSKYTLTPVHSLIRDSLKKSLTDALGILVVVKKIREIYYIDNIKVHLDIIDKLGLFVEIEARDEKEDIAIDALTKQCSDLIDVFQIKQEQLISKSYSDLIYNEMK